MNSNTESAVKIQDELEENVATVLWVKWNILVNGLVALNADGSSINVVWEPTTLSGVWYIDLEGAVANSVSKLVALGGGIQNGTPTPTNPLNIICNNGEIKWDSVNEEIYIDWVGEKISSESDEVSVENLLGIWGVRDEQEVIGGEIIRRIWVKVLDGTENWSSGVNGYSADILDNSLFNHLLCTHFVNGIPVNDLTCSKGAGSSSLLIHYEDKTSVESFKSWLESEYNNWTPVIVLYVLENEISDSIEWQGLDIPAWDSRVEANGSINDLMIEITYNVL